jgi:hypothetical protein
MTYEVQTLTYFNAWENTWTEDGNEPMVFDTYETAAAELASFIDDMQHTVKNRFMADFNPEDYRIKKI